MVTGATRGLGLAMAKALLAAGGEVAFASRSEKKLTEAYENLKAQGYRAHILVLDVRNEDSVTSAVYYFCYWCRNIVDTVIETYTYFKSCTGRAMRRPKYVVAVVLIVLALGLSVYYLSQGVLFKNVDLIKSTTTANFLELQVASVEYYPGAAGYLVIPRLLSKLPGVVMIHEWWGVNDNIKGMAQQLAKEGYAVLAADLFNGKVASTPDEASSLASKLNSTEAIKNLRAAVNYLKTDNRVDQTKIGSIGWCFGGGQSLRLGLSGEELAATVIYYGELETNPQKLSPIKWPVLGIFGDQDRSIPIERIRAFESSLKQLGVRVEIHIYPAVGHAFANPSSQTYAPKETLDAWQKTLAFFASTLKEQ